MKIIKLSLLLLALILPASAYTAAPMDLYGGEVPVADESPENRSAALQQVLRKVLVRVSGNRGVLNAAAVPQVLQEAGSLVQKFRYRSQAAPPESGEAGEKFLHARFDPAGLHRVMARHGLPVWLAQRPRVLLWVATEENGVRRLLNVGEDIALQGLLRQRARERGMPLQVPLLDLEDRAAITASDIWSGYADAIKQASSRYPHDVVLSGRMRSLGNGRWSGEWRLWREGRYFDMTADAGGMVGVLVSGIDLAQDQLASGAATSAVARADLTRVLVEGVYGLEAYSRLLRLVAAITEIQSLVVLEVSAEGLLLGAQVERGRESLARELEAIPELIRLPLTGGVRISGELTNAEPPAQTADLAYRLTVMTPLE